MKIIQKHRPSVTPFSLESQLPGQAIQTSKEARSSLPSYDTQPVQGIPSGCDERCQQIRVSRLGSSLQFDQWGLACWSQWKQIGIGSARDQRNWCNRLNGREKRPQKDRNRDRCSSTGEGLLGYLHWQNHRDRIQDFSFCYLEFFRWSFQKDQNSSSNRSCDL